MMVHEEWMTAGANLKRLIIHAPLASCRAGEICQDDCGADRAAHLPGKVRPV